MSVLKFFESVFSAECYFRVYWGIYCPGCGGTRAAVALVQGDFIESLKYNPIVMIFVLHVFLMAFLYIFERKKGKYSTAKIRIIVNVTILFFIILFFVVRNYMLLCLGIDVLGDF